ncbi:MAG: aldehyde dehydrogenase family protein [Bacteroidota bacterium]
MPNLPKEPVSYQMLIAGDWVEAQSGDRYHRDSPGHGIKVGTYPRAGVADVDAAVAAAKTAFEDSTWRLMKGADRARLLHRVGEIIREDADDLARIEALESGKPVAQARGEMMGTADLWEYAATLARHTYGDTYNTLGPDMLGMVLREPIGVVGMITPWNFPLLIISQKLPFALATGCTAVIKPSELTPGTTLRLGNILQEVGFPAGVVNIVTGFGAPAGARIAEHPDIDMISFTGSTAVGKKIVAASQGNLKKVSLELGGKNPQIVFADADLEAALDAVVFGAYFNMGECCNAGSRLLVQSSIADQFIKQVVERAKTVPVGDPLDEATKVGAIINDNQYDKIFEYIDAGKAGGAQLKLGGKAMESKNGRFIEPTVFTDVSPDMDIAKNEIFGPVLSIIEFDTVDDAVRIANDSLYGLSAGVWTRNIDHAFQVARNVRAGTIWINSYMDGYPELPFGGYKESGQGRELGRFTLDEFCELKTIQLHMGPRTNWWHKED